MLTVTAMFEGLICYILFGWWKTGGGGWVLSFLSCSIGGGELVVVAGSYLLRIIQSDANSPLHHLSSKDLATVRELWQGWRGGEYIFRTKVVQDRMPTCVSFSPPYQTWRLIIICWQCTFRRDNPQIWSAPIFVGMTSSTILTVMATTKGGRATYSMC